MKRCIWFVFLMMFVCLLSACSTNNENDTKKVEVGQSVKETKSAKKQADIAANAPQLREEVFDIVVIGGEPEGVAAALSAARNGHKTLLVEERDGLGGLFTYGEMNFIDFPKGINNRWTSKGIFQEWHKKLDYYNAFGIKKAKTVFADMVKKEPNLSLVLDTKVIEPMMSKNGKSIEGVTVENSTEKYIVRSKEWIDATQDADFAVKVGVPYFVGGEDIGFKDKKMAVTLVLHYKNVDWNGVAQTVKSRKFGYANMNDHVAWGFNNLVTDYKPVEENTRLRGLNMAKIGDDVYINALQIFNVDGLNKASKEAAIEKGKKETAHILQFLRKEFRGFEQAEIADYPTELYVRESRHILSEYQLPMSDLWKNKDQWDSIAIGGYPVDVQAQSKNDLGYVIAHPTQYAIPFRSIVPLKIEDLLVVGRSSGYSSLAAGSTRIVATGMATGEAAGAAAAIAFDNNINFRDLSKNKQLIELLRNNLKKQGAFVEHFQISYPYQNEWYSDAICTLMDYGLIVAGYQNIIPVEQTYNKHSFVYLVRNTIQATNSQFFTEKVQELTDLDYYLYNEKNETLTRDKAAEMIARIWLEEKVADENVWEKVHQANLVDDELYNRISSNRPLKNKEIYYMLAHLVNQLKK